MDTKGLIKAFQKVLSGFGFQEPNSFSEDFAQKRFFKRFQVPSSGNVKDLAKECWDSYIASDESLPSDYIGNPLPSEWWRARDFLHKSLSFCNLRKIQLPQGSEFIPTRGRNSIEAKLCQSVWTVTPDGFSRFAKICYGHRSLKKAAKVRFSNYVSHEAKRRGLSRSKFFKRISALGYQYALAHKQPDESIGFYVFKWKMSFIVTEVQGSRFSTVPKNNEKRRPINVEPFGNTVGQRALGNWLRDEIHRLFNVNLDTLADVHRRRIADDDVATIDLKDASDRISLALCRWLLPKRVLKHLEALRSPMVLGHDGHYHLIKKISSMGNGFTFELMTLILTTICRTLDPEATVFGDDIIIRKDCAERLIYLLEEASFNVNQEKSFISGPFRESCGANFHDCEGYIESYDFEYPETIGDCVMIWNKCYRLKHYPSFQKLSEALHRILPPSLRGGPDPQFEKAETLELVGRSSFFSKERDFDVVDFPSYFVTSKSPRRRAAINREHEQVLSTYQLAPHEFYLVRGYEFRSKLRSPTLRKLHPRRHWAKIQNYIFACRRTKDVISSEGEWVTVWFVKSNKRCFRASSLVLD